VHAPEFVRADKFSYVKDGNGRVYIVTTNSKDFDDAIKAIHPGPSSVDKLDLWVVTPLSSSAHGKRPPDDAGFRH
jgi:hypothetical protein